MRRGDPPELSSDGWAGRATGPRGGRHTCRWEEDQIRIERVRPLLMLTDALIPNPLRGGGAHRMEMVKRPGARISGALPAFSFHVVSDGERGRHARPLIRWGARRQHRPGSETAWMAYMILEWIPSSRLLPPRHQTPHAAHCARN